MRISTSELDAIKHTSNKFTKVTEGAIFSTKQGFCMVTQYINCSNVKVQFLDTGGITFCRAANLRAGSVSDPLYRGVFGVGYLDNAVTVDENGIPRKSYIAWNSLLSRRKDSIDSGKNHITVCEEWFSYENFKEWYETEILPFLEAGLNPEVDSDLFALVNSTNKHYSPETCVLLTKTLNVMLASLKKQLNLIKIYQENGGQLPAGIQYDRSRNRYHLKVFGKLYKTFKEDRLGLELHTLRQIRIRRFLTQAQKDIDVLSDKAILLMNEIQ